MKQAKLKTEKEVLNRIVCTKVSELLETLSELTRDNLVSINFIPTSQYVDGYWEIYHWKFVKC